jgi:hypothetical protein
LEILSKYSHILSLMNVISCIIVIRMGISSKPGTVYFRNKEFLISSLITKLGSREHVSCSSGQILRTQLTLSPKCVWNWLSNSSTHAVTWDTRPTPAIVSVRVPLYVPTINKMNATLVYCGFA